MRHDPNPWPKVNCKTCGLFKRAYGKDICRGCYRTEWAEIIRAARNRALVADLKAIRQQAIDKGLVLLSPDEIDAEVQRRR